MFKSNSVGRSGSGTGAQAQQDPPLSERWGDSLASSSNTSAQQQLMNVDLAQVAICALMAKGGPCVLYATKDFTNSLKQYPIAWGALEAMTQPATFICKAPSGDSAGFYFVRNGVEYRVKLDYLRDENSKIAQGRINRVEIFNGQNRVFPHVAGGAHGTEPRGTKRRLEDLTDVEKAIVAEMNDSAKHRSSAMGVMEMVARSEPPTLPAFSSSNTGAHLTIPPSIGRPTGPSPSEPTIFDVLHRKADPAALPVHRPGVYETLKTTTVDNSDKNYDLLVPKGSSLFAKPENSEGPRSTDKAALRDFIRFLGEKHPPLTLAGAMKDLVTFSEMKKLFLQNNQKGVYLITFFNRFCRSCFYLPAVEIFESDLINLRGQSAPTNLQKLNSASNFEELLASNGTSMATLLANRDERSFETHRATMQTQHKDHHTKVMLSHLADYFKE